MLNEEEKAVWLENRWNIKGKVAYKTLVKDVMKDWDKGGR